MLVCDRCGEEKATHCFNESVNPYEVKVRSYFKREAEQQIIKCTPSLCTSCGDGLSVAIREYLKGGVLLPRERIVLPKKD